ncbi:MAG: hypothetical protein OXR03_27570, partial [Rhodospirillaceae bacterium]|nr:hypothetical protein [Rhodospirillaceae bacterium]
ETRLPATLAPPATPRAPVSSGDTAYPAPESAGLEEQRTTGVMVLRTTVHNQRDELCLEGTLRMLVAKRSRDEAA